MNFLPVSFICITGVILVILATSLICFFIVFYFPTRKPDTEEYIKIPKDKIYDKYRAEIEDWIKCARTQS